jgi:putative nucleotidyltransferase with HDIG domain
MDPNSVYMPISIDELTSGTINPVDLFVRISGDKYVQVAKADTSLDLNQIKNYQTHAIEYLYIRKEDYAKLARQTIQLAGMVVDRKDISPEKKSIFLTSATKTVFKRLNHIGFDVELYNNAKQVTEAVVSLVDTQKTFSALIAGLAGTDDDLLNHSVAVSTLSTIIGTEMKFQNKATLEKLALGGLLHDIGLRMLPASLVKKPQIEMSSEELQLYETHPFKGARLLAGLGVVPDDIVSIVYEHHENANGQGYPQRIRDVKIHPLAKIVALANQFIELTLEGPNCVKPRSPREALHVIEHIMGLPFNKEAFRALKRVIEKEPLYKKAAGE